MGRCREEVVKILYRPETPARRSCHRDKSDHVYPVPGISVRPGDVQSDGTSSAQRASLPKLFDGRGQKTVAVIDLEYN